MEDDSLTRRVLACCYVAHRTLGAGYPETTYQRAVTRELEREDMAFTCEVWLPVLYQGEEIDRVHADFVVERQLLLEVCVKSALEKEDTTRASACLKASGLPRGLLVNFGTDELQVKRLAARISL